MAIDILSHIRARISELSSELEALRKAEHALAGKIESASTNETSPSVTEGILLALQQGPMKKPEIETIIRSRRSEVGKQTVAGTLQSLRRRGKVKLLKGGKWTLTQAS